MTFVALVGSDRQRSIKPLFAELAEAFHACGLDMPKINLVTLSTHLQVNLLATGPFAERAVLAQGIAS